MSDTLGRPACVAGLLRRAEVAPVELCTESRVLPVLTKLLKMHPNWITMLQSPVASVVVETVTSPLRHDLAPCVQEWLPISINECCGTPLARWKLVPATFLTLASGLKSGHVVCFKCFKCNSVYAGCWQWLGVCKSEQFPEGHHSPRLVSANALAHRWFFATPQLLVVETVLLAYVLGLLARGGVSFTGFAAVYSTMWLASMEGTMYASRTHFLQKLELNIIVYAAIMMFAESGLCVRNFAWTLRPHHEARDFEDLLGLVRQAFEILARAHACWLFRSVPALVVDGKWCIQTSICNALATLSS
jgi:hypothetical protein